MKKALLIVLAAALVVILLFWIVTSGRYTEEDARDPDTVRITGPVMSRRFSDGSLDFRAVILMLPDLSAGPGRLRVVTPFSDRYPLRSSELLYYDLIPGRVVLSSLAYDEGVTETVYRRGGPETTDPGSGGEPSVPVMDFERIVIGESVAELAEDGEYEILCTDGGVRVSYYYGIWDEEEEGSREDCLESRVEGGEDLYGRILALADECGLAGWDGFRGEDDEVLDGGGFSFRAVINGREMRASGSNVWPAGYGTFIAAIRDILRERG